MNPRLGVLALALLSLPAHGAAQSQTDVLLYGSLVDYQGSRVKRDGLVAGGYGSWGTGYRHLLELGGSWTHIRFRGTGDLDQLDVTAAYNFYSTRASVRGGGHLVQATDPLTDGSLIVFGGGDVYDVGRWSLGVHGAWSHYPNFDGGLDVGQLAPTGGLTIRTSDPQTTIGLTARGYFIRLSEPAGMDQRDFSSGELAASLTKGRFRISGYGWLGEQAFAVRESGFTVFNLSEIHKGGFGGGFRWVTTQNSALSAGYYVERFEDLGYPDTATARTFTLSFGYTF